MPHRLASLPKLPLSDDDLKALGLVVAYWARAEASLENTLTLLAVNDREQNAILKSERLISFSKKAAYCKKLLKLTCSEYPELHRVGAELVTRGKLLANRRKIIAHWCAAHRTPNQETVFVDFGRLKVGKIGQISSLTRDDILSLAADTAEWWRDLGAFNLALVTRGPTASRTIEL